MTIVNNIPDPLDGQVTKFNKITSAQRRVPHRVPDFQNPRFGEMVGKQTTFIVTKAIFSKLRSEFFKIEEFETDKDIRETAGITDNYFNAPVYDYLGFSGGTYRPIDLPDDEPDVEYGGGEGSETIITSVLLEASQSKNIVKTDIQGRDGVIKEFIGNGDLVFSARGVIVGQGKKYPLKEVQILRDIFSAQTALDVTCDFITAMAIGDYDVVVESWNMPQRRGVRNQQEFEVIMSINKPLLITAREALR
ncbi:MAG: hypothetical protein GY861_05550 [bacterium]|nr:hypothetical protein [bacterium]